MSNSTLRWNEALALKWRDLPVDLPEATELLSARIGLVLVAFGVMDYCRLMVLSRSLRRGRASACYGLRSP